MTDNPSPTSPGHEPILPHGEPYQGGRHAEDDVYLWGDGEVSLVVDVEAAWDQEDTQRLHQITQADELEERFREYAESRLELISNRYASLGSAVGRVALDDVARLGAVAGVAKRNTVLILPWEGRQQKTAE